MPRALVGGDLEKTCALGESLTYPLAAVTSPDNPPVRGLVIGNATAAMCAELEAWEQELTSARAEVNVSGPGQVPTIKDARIVSERHHALAAERYWQAYEATERHYGTVGESCPKFTARKDELTFLIGLISGVNALLHDKVAGGPIGVPLDVMPRVARGAACLDDETWWHVPGALEAGIWATIPGSGPADVDPWAILEEKAASGENTGVRVGRALQVLLSANAGRTELAEAGISRHGESLKSTPVATDWHLLDEYARRISLHQSDLIWTAAKGYRTPTLGDFPQAAAEAPADPFGDDPFGDDPFGAPADPAPADPTPAEEGATEPEETE